MSLQSSINISYRALDNHQKAMAVASANVASANNPDATKQNVHTAFGVANIDRRGVVGGEPYIVGITRSYDAIIEKSLRRASATEHFYQSSSDFTKFIDKFMSDAKTSIDTPIVDFFNALQQCSVDPTQHTRTQVFYESQNIVDRVNSFTAFINGQRSLLVNQAEMLVDDVNRITTDLKSVNDILSRNVDTNQNALLDKRDALLRNLSEYFDVDVQTNADETVYVRIGGYPLLWGSTVTPLSVVPNMNSDKVHAEIHYGSEDGMNITPDITKGKLGALINNNNQMIVDLENQVGRILTSLALTMNYKHEQGMDLNGEKGNKLFSSVNTEAQMYTRVQPKNGYTSNAMWKAEFLNIPTLFSDHYALTSNPTVINPETYSPEDLSTFSINGVTLSSIENPGPNQILSAKDFVNAINNKSFKTGVSAKLSTGMTDLGIFLADANQDTMLTINGIDTELKDFETIYQVSSFLNANFDDELLAEVGEDGHLRIYSFDGENIEVSLNNTDESTSFFSEIPANQNYHQVFRSTFELSSENTFSLSDSFRTQLGLDSSLLPKNQTELKASNYELSYDGDNYTLLRLMDKKVVYQGQSSSFSADGIDFELADGTSMRSRETLIVKPYENIYNNFSLEINHPDQLALAYPIDVYMDDSNTGDAKLSIKLDGASTYISGISPKDIEYSPIKIEFLDENTFKVIDLTEANYGAQLGPVQYYNGTSITISSITGVDQDTSTITYRPGYAIEVSGVVEAGDVFFIKPNQDATLDSRNSLEMGLLNNNLVMDGYRSFSQELTKIRSFIGGLANQYENNYESYKEISSYLAIKRNEISGINLDEEAAKIIKLQQAYQAAAQVLSVTNRLFDSLLSIFS